MSFTPTNLVFLDNKLRPYLSVANRERIGILFLAFTAASICHVVSLHVSTHVIHLLPSWHAANIDGTGPAPNQYRWASFYAPEFLMASLNVTLTKAYLILRVFTLTVAFWFAALISQRLVPERSAAALAIMAIALYYAAATQLYFQPAEEPNLMVFAIFIWMVMRGYGIVPLAIIFTIGAINKSTVVFLIPFLFTYRWAGQKDLRTAIKETAILISIFITAYAAVRLHYGIDRPYSGGLWQIKHNLYFVLNLKLEAYMWMLPVVIPTYFIVRRWDDVPLVVKCFLPAAAMFAIGHFLISRMDEFRTYTPLALLLWPGALATLCVRKSTTDYSGKIGQ